MASYDTAEKERLLSIPVPAVLEHFGCRTDHRGQMYYSPFRDEREPSFHVNPQGNLWMDFGLGRGGNVLTLVGLLAGVPLAQAWDRLAGLYAGVPPQAARPLPAAGAASREPLIVIDTVSGAFCSPTLLRYAASRGIPESLLARYCRQVSYHLRGQEGRFLTAIGFPAGDGWVLRHPGHGHGTKRCTSGRCSLLGPGGQTVSSPRHDTVQVFEGFFDFLSWMVLGGKEEPGCDVCVLNSVNNLGRSLGFIAAHRGIDCWTDDDEAGRRALERILAVRPDAADRSALLAREGCKDVGELLEARLADKTLSVPSGTFSLSINKKHQTPWQRTNSAKKSARR